MKPQLALTTCASRSSGLPPTLPVIDGLTPPHHISAPAETATATVYQRIVTMFNEHPGKVFRVRDLHEYLDLPTDEPSINVTCSRLGRLARQGFLEQPGRGRDQKRT